MDSVIWCIIRSLDFVSPWYTRHSFERSVDSYDMGPDHFFEDDLIDLESGFDVRSSPYMRLDVATFARDSLNVKSLWHERLGGVKIQWTSSLGDHLKIENGKLHVYWHASTLSRGPKTQSVILNSQSVLDSSDKNY